uniref:Uncharacterized protein n=1 Tax=Octopus bimaculoides TaxID=37653 RepID=A0A0L8IB30_OCTBM
MVALIKGLQRKVPVKKKKENSANLPYIFSTLLTILNLAERKRFVIHEDSMSVKNILFW